MVDVTNKDGDAVDLDPEVIVEPTAPHVPEHHTTTHRETTTGELGHRGDR